MIPAWKLQREIMRVVNQFAAIPHKIRGVRRSITEHKRRTLHDATFLKTAVFHEGVVPVGPRVAVFLIFQPKGIEQSTFDTLQMLIDAGFAPLVVSNAPVSQADVQRLKPYTWRFLQRPNFGYDFGGYRDGILSLKQLGADPECLIVMNDSVWHLYSAEKLEEWIKLPVDFTGLLQDEKVIHDTKGGVESNRRHIESYLFVIKGDLVRSKTFWDFWQNYRMSDNKDYTIKCGELGFSRYLAEKGIELRGVTLRSTFLAGVSQFSYEDLRKSLKYGGYDIASLRNESAKLLAEFAETPEWRTRAYDHIRRAVMRRRFTSCFCYATHLVFGTLSLKKTQEDVFLAMRQQYLRAIEAGDLPELPPAVMAEMRAKTAPL